MSVAKEIILVTGASGFLGAHVVHELLVQSYNVRAVARSAKVALLQGRYAQYGARVEVVALDDIIAGDYAAALRGVSGVIHVASPGIGQYDAQKTVEAATKGALNIAAQALDAGVKKLVVTSSIVSLIHPSEFGKLDPVALTADNWSGVTEEEVAQNAESAMFAYAASKAIAERALWDFAKLHPPLDLTTIVPPMLFGTFAPEQEIAKDDLGAMSTNAWLYQVFTGDRTRAFPELPSIPSLDVRDAARAHVLALRAAPSAAPKRLLVSGGAFSWRELVEFLALARPALKGRLIDVGGLPAGDLARSQTVMDIARAKEVLGIAGFKTWQQFILESVDDLLRVEKSWETRPVPARYPKTVLGTLRRWLSRN